MSSTSPSVRSRPLTHSNLSPLPIPIPIPLPPLSFSSPKKSSSSSSPLLPVPSTSSPPPLSPSLSPSHFLSSPQNYFPPFSLSPSYISSLHTICDEYLSLWNDFVSYRSSTPPPSPTQLLEPSQSLSNQNQNSNLSSSPNPPTLNECLYHYHLYLLSSSTSFFPPTPSLSALLISPPHPSLLPILFVLFADFLSIFHLFPSLSPYDLLIFAVRVRDLHYDHNGYHNYHHAIHVSMTATVLAYPLLSKEKNNNNEINSNTPRQILSQYDIIRVVFSSLLHDVRHIGVSNALLVSNHHPISRKYPSSPLEALSTQTGYHICNKEKMYGEGGKYSFADICSKVINRHKNSSAPHDQNDSVSLFSLDYFGHLIMPTDISNKKTHNEILDNFHQIHVECYAKYHTEKGNGKEDETKRESEFSSALFKSLSSPSSSTSYLPILQLILLLSDIGCASESFSSCCGWAKRLFNEIYLGENEIEMGNTKEEKGGGDEGEREGNKRGKRALMMENLNDMGEDENADDGNHHGEDVHEDDIINGNHDKRNGNGRGKRRKTNEIKSEEENPHHHSHDSNIPVDTSSSPLSFTSPPSPPSFLLENCESFHKSQILFLEKYALPLYTKATIFQPQENNQNASQSQSPSSTSPSLSPSTSSSLPSILSHISHRRNQIESNLHSMHLHRFALKENPNGHGKEKEKELDEREGWDLILTEFSHNQ